MEFRVMSDYCLIVPCYNEEKRLDLKAFKDFLTEGSVDLCFVNDGSKDKTLEVLTNFCDENSKAQFLDLEKNSGKAEAVRRGVSHCIEQGYSCVGYWDADLATPLCEVPGFVNKLKEGKSVVMGSRILRLGGAVERKWYRHYLGRLFATIASTLLKMPVYDTQCGAKFFRSSDCKEAFEHPFNSQWLFDVEVLFRLKRSGLPLTKYYEIPLSRWKDEHGSKLKLIDFLIAPFELLQMYWKYK